MNILFIMKESIMNERIGLMYLSSNLKLLGHEVKLVLADRLGSKGLLKLFHDYSPSLVGYSAMTGEHLKLLEINIFLKENFKFISIFGGPHVTFFPNFIYEESVDAICIGEGDIALMEFCRKVENDESYWETPNFISKNNGNIFRNPLLPLVNNLDDLAFPDRDLMYEADQDLLREEKKDFFSSRGCPYHCSYCFNEKYNELYSGKGDIIRFRSPENLVEEICRVKYKYPISVAYIHDDIFLLKPKDWFASFSQLYRKRVDLPFSCNVRANLVNEEIISILKDAGLDSVWMGVECGNEIVANDILGRNLKNSQILRAVKIIQKYGIKIITQNLIGIPIRDSYKADIETLDLNIEINPTFAWSSILYPYPGTKVTYYAKKNGFVDKILPFLETNKRSTIFKYPKKEKRKIENLHKLFGIIVRFPFLRKYCHFLCALPISGFYTYLFYLWYGYNIKIKIYPFRSYMGEVGRYFRLWLRFVRKS